MPQPKTKPGRRSRDGAGPSSRPRAVKAGEVLTLAEAAAFLRVTEQDVLSLVGAQGLPGRKVGDDWRFLKAAVAGWLGAAAAADKGQFWQTHFGALKDDPYLEGMLQEIYRRRGRPETDES